MTEIANSLNQGVKLIQAENGTTAPDEEFTRSLSATLQELALRLNQISTSGGLSSSSLQNRRALVQESREALQEATLRLKEGKREPALSNAVRGCLVALRVAEHVSAQQVVTAAQPVFQTLHILEKSCLAKQVVLNVKLLGMKMTKFLELCGRKVHDIRVQPQQAKVQANVYIVNKLFPILVQALGNSIARPNNAYDRASRDYFFGLVRQATENIVKGFTTGDGTEGNDGETLGMGGSDIGRFVKTVDQVLDDLDCIKTNQDFPAIQANASWLVSFAMNVAKVSSEGEDNKDITNACHHVVNELATLKEALDGQQSVADIALAREVSKDFVEVLEQVVNTSLLRLIVEAFSQLHVPLDKLVHHVLISEKKLPDRLQEDISVEAMDDHADHLFHIAQFAKYCTSDLAASQTLENSFELAQLLEKELVPACLKVYFNPGDVGARTHLRTLRALWKAELDCIESCVLDIVDPTAFCVVVEAVARRIASSLKKGLYSQDRNWLRSSVSRLVKLCQMAVDFAWKEVAANDEEQHQHLPEDHPIIRVERSSWEATTALKMVVANVEDLHLHKVLIRRVQLMVTSMSAMVECLVDCNKTDHQKRTASKSEVRVLTSVSRVSIIKEDDHMKRTEVNNSRWAGKSFKNITMANTIGISGGKSRLGSADLSVKLFDIPLETTSTGKDIVMLTSRKRANNKADESVNEDRPVNTPTEAENPDAGQKSLFRKIKVHSDSSGFRSPLKQINNQLQSASAKNKVA